MRKLTVAAIVALAVASCTANTGSSPATAPAPTDTGVPRGTPATVVRVLDGDSLLVALDSEEREVRLLGVNAPEGSECHGDEAKAALERLVAGGDLTLVADGDESDQYGRLLRYMFVDGSDINRELLATGDAIVLQGSYGAESEFVASSDRAAAERLGLWAADACGTGAPLPSAVITGYAYDPPGRDEDTMNDEWVAIANHDGESIAMEEWILRDESTQNRFRFPAGFTLAAGAEVVVRSGCGTNTATNLYWCAASPVWSNGGDTVILQLPDGTVVAHVRYSGE